MKLNHLIVGTCVSTACALCSSAESVSYFDFEAGTKKSTNGVMVTATTAELGEGWYVASGEVAVGTLALTGDANLILADSATLTVNGGIAGEGRSLTVWGQEGQTGKLVVNGTNGVNGAVTIPVIWPGIPGSMKVKIIDSLRDNPVYREVFMAWYEQNYGADAVKAGGKGGAGIVCEVLTVNGGEVSVSGGAGGQGDVGRRGEDGKNGTIYYAAAGTDGGPGGKGGDGGKGGTAIVCTACVLRGGTLTATAGKGGDGGNGGNGGNGGDGYTQKATDPTYAGGNPQKPDGGDGGKGGDGGDGGEGGMGLEGVLVAVGGSFVSTGGEGGSAGTYGIGGRSGEGGNYRHGFSESSEDITGKSGLLSRPASDGYAGVAGKAFGDEPQLMNYTSVTTDDEVWDLKTPLVTFHEVEIVGGSGAEGTSGNKWQVGKTDAAAVTAYIYNDELVVEGTGAMRDFTKDDPAPWTDQVGSVTAVTVGTGVTEIGRNAFVVLGDAVPINGFPSSLFRMMGKAYGEVLPSDVAGALAAEPEYVEIMDGKALLGASVYTSDTLTNQNWSVATNGVIEVPAPGKQGFFYLMSKPAAPADLVLDKTGRIDASTMENGASK